MNARIPIRARVDIPPWDRELEENALGVALLGYPLPDWLEEADFSAPDHRQIFRAVQELGASASLPSVASLLRERGQLAQLNCGGVSSVALVAMMDGADHAMRMGWAVEFERLRELRGRRELLAKMRRVEAAFELDAMTVVQAREVLR